MTTSMTISSAEIALDEKTFTESGSLSLRVLENPEDPESAQWMLLQERSGAFDFWMRPEEDVYSDDDGMPA